MQSSLLLANYGKEQAPFHDVSILRQYPHVLPYISEMAYPIQAFRLSRPSVIVFFVIFFTVAYTLTQRHQPYNTKRKAEMGAGCFKQYPEEHLRAERYLEQERRRMLAEVKLLLLGMKKGSFIASYKKGLL
jgi:hypothetical protein